MESIPLATARKLALKHQLIASNNLPPGKSGALEVVRQLGYIQIDTISVIERAHHHTLWSRVPDYQPGMMDELLAEDRAVFEYWGHGASYLPIEDYRFYLPKMKSFLDPIGKWEKNRYEKYGRFMQPILERIRQEGALSAKDFELPQGRKKKDGWWDWHEMKSALELLYWQGDLMIKARNNFHKVYDLTERILPQSIDTSYPSDEELGRFLVIRALRSYALASEKEINNYILAADRKIISQTLKAMLNAGEVVKVKIGDLPEVYFTLPRMLDDTEFDIPDCINILSPFDNLVIQRERLKRLFLFDYAIECYTPPKKRIYGYFVLPVLWGEKFAARLDAKADRKNRRLMIQKLAFEPGFNEKSDFMTPFKDKLDEFARFNRCDEVIFP